MGEGYVVPYTIMREEETNHVCVVRRSSAFETKNLKVVSNKNNIKNYMQYSGFYEGVTVSISHESIRAWEFRSRRYIFSIFCQKTDTGKKLVIFDEHGLGIIDHLRRGRIPPRSPRVFLCTPSFDRAKANFLHL